MTNEIRAEADIDTFVHRFQEPEDAGEVPIFCRVFTTIMAMLNA